jgi:very-short-patch-repair endonuclease
MICLKKANRLYRYDNERTQFLQSCGYKVLRVWNNEVFKDIDSVLEEILSFLETKSH